MTKYSQEKIEEAKVLRSEGKSHNEIANTLSISRMCSIRWLKMGYKRGVSNIEGKDPKEALDNVNLLNNQSNESGNKDKEGTNSNNGTSFHSMKVAFDNKTGGIILEQGEDEVNGHEASADLSEDEAKGERRKANGKPLALSPEPLALLKANGHEANDIKLIDFLLPAALLGAGLLMSGKKDTSSNAFRAKQYRESW